MPMFDPIDDEELDPRTRPMIAAPMSEKPPINLPGIGAPIPSVTPTQPKVNPQMAADKSELQRLESTGSGVSQLQKRRPVLGTLARIADVVGSIAAPGAASLIPGTSLHHNMLVGQQRGKVAQDVNEQERESQGAEEQARADAIANPPQKEPKTAFELWHQQNPQGTVADWNKLEQEGKAGTVHPTIQATDDGFFSIDPSTGIGKPVMFNGQPLKPAKKPEAPHTVNTAEGVMQYDPATGGYTKRIGGTPQMVIADTNRETKLSKAQAADQTQLSGFNASMDRLATAANELMTHPGLGGITGVMGSIGNLPGTQAADAESKLHTLKSQVAFTTLQEMRNSSKTGGALGQVSDNEEKMLMNALAPLEKAQSVESMKKALMDIKAYTEGAKARATEAIQRTYGGGNPQAQPQAQDLGPAPAGKAEGATGTLQDGTKVVVRGGRMVKAQ